MVATLLALAVLSTSAGAQEDPERIRDRLEATRSQLSQAEGKLEDVTTSVAATRSDLQAVDRRLVGLLAEQQRLEAELAAAQQRVDDAAARTARATEELQQQTAALEQARAELARQERTFDDRVAAAYKFGPISYVDALLGVGEFDDFVTTVYYVRSVFQAERGMIADMEDLTETIRARRSAIDELRDDLLRQQEAAQAARDQVRRATERQQQLAADVAAERQRRQHVLGQLEATRAHYQHLVEDLQEESRALARELRTSRWRAGAPGIGELVWPTDGVRTSGFGWRRHPIFGAERFHAGIDISGDTGQPVVSASEGLVVSAGWRGGYGLAVVVDHGGGLATLYAHLSRIVVGEGAVVDEAQKIGEVGSTGWSTGPHLHYEVRVQGEPRDPMRWYG